MASRKTYSREFKLDVVNFHHHFGLYKTKKNFDLNSNNVCRWVQQEKELILGPNTSRTGTWPELEDRLAKEIEDLRQKESRVTRHWVMNRAKELKQEMDPSNPLSFSVGWCAKFLGTKDPSNSRTTSANGYSPGNKAEKLQELQKFTMKNERGSRTRQQGRLLVCTRKKCGYDVTNVKRDCDENIVNVESQEASQERSGFDVIKVKREFDESQVPMELLETSQELQGDWTAVEIKVEQDDHGEEGTSQDLSSDPGGSVSMEQDQSGSPGLQGDIQDALEDQWQGAAWIKKEIDADDLNEEDTFCQRDGTKTSWQGDGDNPIITQDVQSIGDPLTVNTWLKRADVGNIDVANRRSFPSEVPCREGPKQEEHDNASFEPPCQGQGSQEHNMEREYKDSEDKVDTRQIHHVCGVCSKAFKIKSNLEAHKKTHHSEKLFACKMCSELFVEKGQFSTHMRQHNKYACMFCSETFADKDELREHVMSHPGSRLQVCGLCPERFHRKHDLTAHMVTHISERTFACDVCSKTFRWKKSLKKHMREGHNRPKNHACGLCIEKFRFKKELRKHVKRVHTVARPHTCNLCSKAFSKKHYLELHMNVHTGEVCDICSQAFSSEAELKLHIMTMHFEGRPYDCDFCSKSFKRKSTLDKHRRWTHRESLQGVNC